MSTEFKDYLKIESSLSETAMERIIGLSLSKRLFRGESVLKIGEVSSYKIFVAKGLLKTYNFTPDGHEHILQFSPELTWTLDIESYELRTPSRFSIAAVEASDVLMWHKDDFDTLLKELPDFKVFAERLIGKYVHSSRQRIFVMLSSTPEEKYNNFITTYPDFLSRIPLRMIAAYLGISLKTLNRIRQAQLQR